MPAVVHAIQRQYDCNGPFRVNAAPVPGGIVISSIAPSFLEAFISDAKLRRWTTGRQEVVRLHDGHRKRWNEHVSHPVAMHIGNQGEDLQALVISGGRTDARHIGTALEGYLGVDNVASVLPTMGYDPRRIRIQGTRHALRAT